MFSLSVKELKGKKILDCPAGACSFTALGNKAGLDVTACDIAYYHSIDDLENKGLQDIDHAMEQMERAKNNYVWDYFKDIEALRKNRLNALKDCANDMGKSSDRYVSVTLPSLPFKDEEFDVLLLAHFLFMYADRLDYQFHISTLNELLRGSSLSQNVVFGEVTSTSMPLLVTLLIATSAYFLSQKIVKTAKS